MNSERHLEVRNRILEGTNRAICAAGVRRTSVEDVARESGCSRATIYRHFPGGRDELLEGLVEFEYARFFLRLSEAVEGASSLEEVMVTGLMVAHRALEELEVLQIILREQPELLEPTLVRASQPTVSLVAGFLSPYLEAYAGGADVALELHAGYLARMVLSYISAPGRWDLADAAQVRRLVRCELLAGIGEALR